MINSADKCKIDGCDNKMYVRKHGLCQGHYNRVCRQGDAGRAVIRPKRKLNPYLIPQASV